jgi:hypothetical protein
MQRAKGAQHMRRTEEDELELEEARRRASGGSHGAGARWCDGGRGEEV